MRNLGAALRFFPPLFLSSFLQNPPFFSINAIGSKVILSFHGMMSRERRSSKLTASLPLPFLTDYPLLPAEPEFGFFILPSGRLNMRNVVFKPCCATFSPPFSMFFLSSAQNKVLSREVRKRFRVINPPLLPIEGRSFPPPFVRVRLSSTLSFGIIVFLKTSSSPARTFDRSFFPPRTPPPSFSYLLFSPPLSQNRT